MTKSYSDDLRKRVIEYLDSGRNYKEASKLFKEVYQQYADGIGDGRKKVIISPKLEVGQKRELI